jgi:hypothetical protein
VGEFIEAIDSIVSGILGWRYIFSSSYRKQTHSRWRWRAQGRLTKTMDIVESIIGVSFTLFLVGLIVYLII